MSLCPNQDAAITLASMGLHVFPCNPDKTPMVTAWEQAATCSPFAISAKWGSAPEALPAIPVGAHGLVVIDCDRKPSAPDGVEAFRALCAAHSIDLSGAFQVDTPSGGQHWYFRTETPYGNSRGSLPEGIDVRGVGGYVIGPGATLPDLRVYRHTHGTWDAIPALPDALAALLHEKRLTGSPQATGEPVAVTVTDRERAFARAALTDEATTLSGMREGSGRNAALNTAAHSLGTLVGNGSIEADAVGNALFEAATKNSHVLKHGERQTRATIESGLNAGMNKPRSLLSEGVDLPALEIARQSCRNLLATYKAKHESKHQSAPASGKRTVNVMQGSQIQAQPIEWLWDGFLPLGKLTLLAGAGGTGKSTIAFNFAATITNAGTWPDGSRCNVAGNVLIWSSEDDPADTIKPRLIAVGANENRYGVINGTINEQGLRCPFDAAQDMDELRVAVSRIGGISLLIIDPILSAVTGDMHRANDVRRSLQSIVDFAAEMRCSVLGITHFAKSTAGKNSAERVIGSQAFAALARMVLVAAKEEDSDRRVFMRAKSNNSCDTGGFSYTIEALMLQRGIVATRVVWGEALEGSSRSILSEVEGDANDDVSQLGTAKQFLLSTLHNGSAPSKELLEHAREGYGVSAITLRRAQKELGILATKSTFAGGWNWSLPLIHQMEAARNNS